jgi:hypothetical protein
MRSIPSSQKGLSLRDFRKMEYLSQARLLKGFKIIIYIYNIATINTPPIFKGH